MVNPLRPGTVVWAELGTSVGREQGGRRPAVVVSSEDHVDVVTTMTIVVPCTRRDRGWENHIRLTGETGLSSETFAVTEQPRTISAERIFGISGRVDTQCLEELWKWVATWVSQDSPGGKHLSQQ